MENTFVPKSTAYMEAFWIKAFVEGMEKQSFRTGLELMRVGRMLRTTEKER